MQPQEQLVPRVLVLHTKEVLIVYRVFGGIQRAVQTNSRSIRGVPLSKRERDAAPTASDRQVSLAPTRRALGLRGDVVGSYMCAQNTRESQT